MRWFYCHKYHDMTNKYHPANFADELFIKYPMYSNVNVNYGAHLNHIKHMMEIPFNLN